LQKSQAVCGQLTTEIEVKFIW